MEVGFAVGEVIDVGAALDAVGFDASWGAVGVARTHAHLLGEVAVTTGEEFEGDVLAQRVLADVEVARVGLIDVVDGLSQLDALREQVVDFRQFLGGDADALPRGDKQIVGDCVRLAGVVNVLLQRAVLLLRAAVADVGRHGEAWATLLLIVRAGLVAKRADRALAQAVRLVLAELTMIAGAAMGAIVERPSEGSLLHRHAVAAHLQRDRGAMLADLLRDGVERDTLVQSVLNDQPVINCALAVMGLFLVLIHGRTPF